MKKYDGRHRKRIGRKKRELMRWRTLRAAAMRMSPRQMKEFVQISGDPLARATRAL